MTEMSDREFDKYMRKFLDPKAYNGFVAWLETNRPELTAEQKISLCENLQALAGAWASLAQDLGIPLKRPS